MEATSFKERAEKKRQVSKLDKNRNQGMFGGRRPLAYRGGVGGLKKQERRRRRTSADKFRRAGPGGEGSVQGGKKGEFQG